MSESVAVTHWGRIGPLFLTVLVDVFALTIVYPLLPYVAQHFGASPLVAGVLLASFSVCQLVSGPILGRLSDRYGRKPVLLVSQSGTLVGLLIMGLGQGLEWLFVGRILDGLTAGNLSTAQAAIADNTAPEDRTKAFGLFGIAFGLGFLIGPALSGFMAERLGYSAPFLAAAGLSFTSVTLTALLVPRQDPRPSTTRSTFFQSTRRILSTPSARERILELFFYVASFATLTGGLAMFLERRMSFGPDRVGYAFAFSGLVGGLMQGGLGRLTRRHGEARISAVGTVIMVVGYVVLAGAHSLPVLGIALGIGGIGSAVVRPALTTLVTTSVPDDERGLVLGVSQSASSLGQALGPAVAGVLINRGALAGWAIAAAVLASSTLVVRALSHRLT
ncbi:MAG: MFS transporter [Polyangiaceae bacterium]